MRTLLEGASKGAPSLIRPRLPAVASGGGPAPPKRMHAAHPGGKYIQHASTSANIAEH